MAGSASRGRGHCQTPTHLNSVYLNWPMHFTGMSRGDIHAGMRRAGMQLPLLAKPLSTSEGPAFNQRLVYPHEATRV